MIIFPNCKINLGLDIIRKRTDGFHDLETVFYPLPIYDVLEIIPLNDNDVHNRSHQFSLSGSVIEDNPENNLCIKAYDLLKNDFANLPAIRIHLHKTIPIGAGLGGGSADASFTLKLLNRLFNLNLTDGQLFNYAAPLGSDCPFFIFNKTSFASGKGELLEPVNIDLSQYQLVLVNPRIHIHTGNAFSQVTPAQPQHSIKEIVQRPVETWKDDLKNDFEVPVFKQYPELAKIKDELYAAGAAYASMTGSGSSIYGLFDKEKTTSFSFPDKYFVRMIDLKK